MLRMPHDHTHNSKPIAFKIAVSLIVILNIPTSNALSTSFKILNDCTCPQYIASYQCTIGGEGFTIWRGTALDCSFSRDQIVLRHSSFSSGTTASCNDGLLIGRSLNTARNYFTSVLNVNVTTSLEGSNAECAYENGSLTSYVVGSSLISITRDPFPPPSRVWLAKANPGQLVFEWSSVAMNCSALFYRIESTCGECPEAAILTTVSCSILSLPVGSQCRFAVRSVVCDDIIGDLSVPVLVTLKAPEPPTVHVLAKYGTNENKSLLNMDALFNRTIDMLILSDGVEGPPLYYVFSFSDLRGVMCGSANVSVSSSCLNGVCTTTLPPNCYHPNGSIAMSVTSFNVVGEGPSKVIRIDTINKYVEVQFESASHVVCTFVNDMSSEFEKSCSIRYGKCQERLLMTAEGATSPHSPNIVDLELVASELQSFCYTINASNTTFTVIMEGICDSEDVGMQDSISDSVIIILLLLLLIVTVMLTLILITPILMCIHVYRKLYKYNKAVTNNDCHSYMTQSYSF